MAATRAERESGARAKILAAFDAICPGIHGNPYVPHWPTPPQQMFLGLHLHHPKARVFEALYGGAAGGGKSNAILSAAAQFVHVPGYAALILRRTFQDLALPGAIMDRAMAWWRPRGVHWNGERKTFTFPSGATVTFGYMQHEHDHLQYQGSEIQFCGWDELTQFPRESQYRYVSLSRVRRKAGVQVPPRALSASNPGGPGHSWVKARFVGDQEAGVPGLHPYVPARIVDNPHLDRETYLAGLRDLHPTVRAQLEDGDWRAREPGDYFRAEWFGPLLDPAVDTWPSRDCVRIRWWDLAASEKPDAARTAGCRMARHRSGVRAIEHCRAFRATPGKRDDLIVQTAKADGHGVVVGLEIEGGSGGPAQFEALAKRLRSEGFKVVGARPRVGAPDLTDREKATMIRQPGQAKGKEGRADPVASCLERGYQRRGECANTGGPWWGADVGRTLDEQRDGLRLFAGPWTQDFLDELEGFPPENDGLCDQVDATSGAWAWLEAHPMGSAVPFEHQQPDEAPDPRDVHPEDRPERKGDRDRGGRWRP